MSLLDKAKTIAVGRSKHYKTVTKEECELVVAFIKGEIRYKQICEVLKLTNKQRGSLTWIVFKIIEAGIRQKLIKIDLVNK